MLLKGQYFESKTVI